MGVELKPDDFAKGPLCWTDLKVDMEPDDQYFLSDSTDSGTRVLILVRQNERLKTRIIEACYATDDPNEAHRWLEALQAIMDFLPPGISYAQLRENLGEAFGPDHLLQPWDIIIPNGNVSEV